jgi:hypothetical protein
MKSIFARHSCAAAALLALMTSVSPASAQFAITDLSRVDIERLDPAVWTGRKDAQRILFACLECKGTSTITIEIRPDDGTGGRIRAGTTTAETMRQIGETNAAKVPGSVFYGAQAISRSSAVGFKMESKAVELYFVNYILWNAGKQLIVRGTAPNRADAQRYAKLGYDQIASQIVR